MGQKAIAIIYSDIHHNVWGKFNKGNRRLKDSISIMKHIKYLSKRLKVPILFCGDMIHKEKNMSNDFMDLLLPKLKIVWSSGENTYAIDGNHDQSKENTIDKPSPSYINTFSKIFKTLICINHKSIETKNFVVHGIPYLTHDIGLLKAIDNRLKQKIDDKINILLLHTNLPGAKDTDDRVIETRLSKDIYDKLKQFDLVLTGHIHKPMKLANNVYQIGATNHQRKTDTKSKLGYWVLYNDLTMKFIELENIPKFIELKVGESFPDNKNFYYHKQKEKKNKNNKIIKDFSKIDDKNKLAKDYLKEKGIKNKKKKAALFNILENTDD